MLSDHIDSKGGDGKATVEALRDVYSMYTSSIPAWLAGLYDKDIGGFYYSVSARDNTPHLPDIESTNQAINLIVNSGMLASPMLLPEKMRIKVAEFVKSLLDPEDGYIYHPQWGKDISASRRGRDLNWAIDMSHKLGFTLPYPPATERLKNMSRGESGKGDVSKLPEHLHSKENFIKYLEGFDWIKDAYYAGNTVAAQGSQIAAAGLADVCVEYLNRFQNPKNGFWHEKSDMHYGINGFLKITAFYISVGAPINMAELAADSAIECITSSEIGTTVCHLYNCYFSLYNILQSLRRAGDEEGARRVEAKLLRVMPEAIRAAKFKAEVFKKPDGAFSYMREHSVFRSQEAVVSEPNMVESDVNASVLSTSGLVNNIHQAFGIMDYRVPIFSDDDYSVFLENLKI